MTDADGSYKAKFKLTCGKGIVQVVMNGVVFGVQTTKLGWLDVPSCNPCGSGSTHTPQPRRTCENSFTVDVGSTGLTLYVGQTKVESTSYMYLVGEVAAVENNGQYEIAFSVQPVDCSGPIQNAAHPVMTLQTGKYVVLSHVSEETQGIGLALSPAQHA